MEAISSLGALFLGFQAVVKAAAVSCNGNKMAVLRLVVRIRPKADHRHKDLGSS
jgi:hypothetical protein